jgi:1,4-alpha-glucan branching enzyme
VNSASSLQDSFQVINGTHRDPFSVLGIHLEQAVGTSLVVVRVFRPDARTIHLIDLDSSEKHPMNLIHDEGMFELRLPSKVEVFPYELEIMHENGDRSKGRDPYSFLPITTEYDRHLFLEGKNYRMYEKMGAHLMTVDEVAGTYFSVWAPNARRVSIVGDFNEWDGAIHAMRMLGESGIWELFIPNVEKGAIYKYEILTQDNFLVNKADPLGISMQEPPETASVVWSLEGFEWTDQDWIDRREKVDHLKSPAYIYEVHLGSWMRSEKGEPLSYQELGKRIVAHCLKMGYTHLELLPVYEHPYYPSWGYQVIGAFAPTARYGPPEDFMQFVNHCHENGISVILDWVPAHFPKDIHGLRRFDGTALYENRDPRMQEQKDWGTLVYDYGRKEVMGYLISNLIYWCEVYHVDGFRVDAVASMLYLDYSREPGEWVPNRLGGRENLEAVEFIRRANDAVHDQFPGTLMIAEESTSWPGVCQPTHLGGLGFDLKWNLGWMNDMLAFMQTDPLYRKFEIGKLTFSIFYTFSENFVLVLSHDEVVHGKRSLLNKMPGSYSQKFANLRLLYGYMLGHPGKKLVFMGGEIAQQIEWNHDQGLDWHLLEYESHRRLNRYTRDLLTLYSKEKALYEYDYDPLGFEWIDFHDAKNTVISYLRKTKNPKETLIFVFNFTPVCRENYRVGIPFDGRYQEILNSDSNYYGGENLGNQGELKAQAHWCQNQPYSLELTLPPLSMLVFKPLDALEFREVGPEKKLLRVYIMPDGVKVTKPPKKRLRKRRKKD